MSTRSSSLDTARGRSDLRIRDCFVGRAVAALAADPQKMSKSGRIYTARELADEYGFTDLTATGPSMPDGRRIGVTRGRRSSRAATGPASVQRDTSPPRS